MTSPFRAEDSGLLVVFMEPGPDVTLEEFHDWYDNEHVPLRTNGFSTFQSAARYETLSIDWPTNQTSSDSVKTSKWAAYYTISSNQVFTDSSYTQLRTQRSERESKLFNRISVIDRRIYRLVYDSFSFIPKQEGDDGVVVGDGNHHPQTRMDIEKNSNYMVAHSITPKHLQEYSDWFDNEHVPLLSKVPSWTRSRRFELIDHAITGTQANPVSDLVEVPFFLGLHEYSQPNPELTPEFKAATDTAWRIRVMGENGENILKRERRTHQLYRAWDPIAALESVKTSSSST